MVTLEEYFHSEQACSIKVEKYCPGIFYSHVNLDFLIDEACLVKS